MTNSSDQTHSVSKRATGFWKRLTEWYGDRVTSSYGEVPPRDWCKLIDNADNDQIKRALMKIRSTYLNYPPTLPQVEAALKTAAIPVIQSKPDQRDQLVEWILCNYDIPKEQIHMPWQWIVRWFDSPDIEKKMKEKHGAEITGVIIPAIDHHPARRFYITDMLTPTA